VRKVKKIIALTFTITLTICFIAVFNSKGVESHDMNSGKINTGSGEIVSSEIIVSSGNIVSSGKSFQAANTAQTEKNQIKEPEAKSSETKATETVSSEKTTTAQTAETTVSSQASKTVRKVDPNKPMVALTFDDGPHYKYTGRILDSLKKNNGLATFFVLGSRAENNKNVIKSIAQNGNQIGNHTYDHKQMTKLSSKALIDQLSRTNNILQSITNITPDVIRPTYGSVNKNVRANSGAPLILWSIDTLDWKTRNQKKIVNEALKNVKDGDIILMHDIYKETAAAADEIMKKLSSKGFQMVTIDELYAARGIKLEDGKVYSKAYKKK
jgi:peptidoglycan/xylan/chitin deacetylase (PgdA/CDA1 family)